MNNGVPKIEDEISSLRLKISDLHDTILDKENEFKAFKSEQLKKIQRLEKDINKILFGTADKINQAWNDINPVGKCWYLENIEEQCYHYTASILWVVLNDKQVLNTEIQVNDSEVKMISEIKQINQLFKKTMLQKEPIDEKIANEKMLTLFKKLN